MKLINIGFGNTVNAGKIIAIVRAYRFHYQPGIRADQTHDSGYPGTRRPDRRLFWPQHTLRDCHGQRKLDSFLVDAGDSGAAGPGDK